jgi:ribose-phosphate pyrophosphokinase
MTPLIAPLPGNETLGERVARAGGFDLGMLETRQFPDGETYLRHRANLSERPVALLCTLNDPDPKLMPLLLAAASARELGAPRVGLVAPYLGYMRQDRQFHEGEAVSAVHFARLLSREFDWLVTVDPHLHRIRRLEDVFTVPCEALHAGTLLAEWVRAEIADPLLIGPDAESEQWVAAAARAAGAPYVVAQKVRSGDRSVAIEIPDLTRWRNCRPVLIDDVASTGRTLLASAEILHARGMRKPACAVVHGIFAGDAFARLQAACGPIVTTNTIEHSSNRIEIAGLLAKAVARIGFE